MAEGKTKNLLFFASGRGSNFQAFLDHVELGILEGVSISGLVCNQPDASVLERAKTHGVPSFEFEGIAGRKFDSREKREEAREIFDLKCLEVIKMLSIDYVILAGFNQIFGKSFFAGKQFLGKILNIHPAFDLKKYGGKNMVASKVHELVISSGASYSGCSVHFVIPEVDQGPVILKKMVPVMKADTPEMLEQRILVEEHLSYPKAVQLLVDERVMLSPDGKKCFVDEYSGGWDIGWLERQKSYSSLLS